MYTPVSTAVFLNSAWWLAYQQLFFFYLTDFDLLIGILDIVPVQQKFEKICTTAIESRSESRGIGPQICLPEGQRTTM